MRGKSLLARSLSLSFGVLFVLSFACSAFGQAGTSTVRGVLKDAQGNVVAGATVTLINPATNATRTTTSTNDGVFTFEQVAVGDCRDGEAAGPGEVAAGENGRARAAGKRRGRRQEQQAEDHGQLPRFARSNACVGLP